MNDLIAAIAADYKTLAAAQGSLPALTTTDKASLVAAINELKAAVAGGGATINDAAGAGNTAQCWSADKVVAQLAALKAEIVAGAPVAYDTLLEIAAKLTGDDTAIAGLLTAVGNRVAFDAAQVLSAAQKAQACANIGVGDPEIDLAALYAAAKA